MFIFLVTALIEAIDHHSDRRYTRKAKAKKWEKKIYGNRNEW
ncbi:MAG: hypothetical protein ACOCRX_07545 [Candidatus Woesearchaeota archaeon]